MLERKQIIKERKVIRPTRLGEVVIGGKLDDHLELRRFADSPLVTRQARDLLIEHMCFIEDTPEVERYGMYLLDFQSLGLNTNEEVSFEQVLASAREEGFVPCTIPMMVSIFSNIDRQLAVGLGETSLYFICNPLIMKKNTYGKIAMTFRIALKCGVEKFGAVRTLTGQKKWKPGTRFIAAYGDLGEL